MHLGSSLRAIACFALLVGSTRPGAAQIRFSVDSRSSLAWWQVNPHLNHLWATTCPQEPTWKPGEGRSGGWEFGAGIRGPKHGHGGVDDTTIIPLYPRFMPLPVCSPAVSGEILVGDTASWREVRGQVVVKAEALVTGEQRRDNFAHEAVLETRNHPEIRFKIDSVVDISRQADTVRGIAVGVFHLHGVDQPMQVRVRAWPEAGGLRTLAKFHVPAYDLIDVYKLSRFALELGVKTGHWYDLFMGIDVVLRATTASGG